MSRLRKWRPSAMEALTEPALESSTTVAPSILVSRAKSSKSFGLSEVTMPTALTQPRQFGWQATQLNFIGSLRSSRVTPACAEPPSTGTRPGNAMQRGAAPSSIQAPVAVERVRAEARSEMRAESETANKNTRIMSMIPRPLAGYLTGLAFSRPRTYTGDTSCCPPGGTASASNLNHG